MFNRYLDPPPAEENPPFAEQSPAGQTPAQPKPPQIQAVQNRPQNLSRAPLSGEIAGGLGDLLGGLLQGFSAEDLDSGDLLLTLIILFLFLEGDNLEIVITLALMLLLGLGDE